MTALSYGGGPGVGPLSDADIARMSQEERVAIASQLMGTLCVNKLPGAKERDRRRKWVVFASLGMAAAMLPWIVLLAFELPTTYRASHWNIAWVGFDAMMLVSLALTAYCAWRGRLVVVLTAFATAIMLVVDAWFDVVTANGSDLWESVLLAVVLEIPIALLLMTFSVVGIVRIARLLQSIVGKPEPLWRMGLRGITESSAAQRV